MGTDQEILPIQKPAVCWRPGRATGLLTGILLAALILGGHQLWAAQAPGKKALSSDEIVTLFSQLDSSRKAVAYSGVVTVRYFARKPESFSVRVWFKPPNLIHFAPLKPLPEFRPEPKLPPERERGMHRGNHPPRRHGEEIYRLMPAQKYLQLFGQNYNVWLQQDGKIAGRPVDLLDIRPKYLPRFGIRLWLDHQHRLILQRQILFYRDGRPPRKIVEIGFKEITLDPVFPDSVLRAAEASARRMEKMRIRMEKHHRNIRRFDSLDSLKQELAENLYVPAELPQGFELVSRSLGVEKERKTVHLHYTDGFLNLSIFEIYGRPPRSLRRYLHRKRPPHDRRFLFRDMLVRRAEKGITFLLIGNLPHFELKRIADSMKPF